MISLALDWQLEPIILEQYLGDLSILYPYRLWPAL